MDVPQRAFCADDAATGTGTGTGPSRRHDRRFYTSSGWNLKRCGLFEFWPSTWHSPLGLRCMLLCLLAARHSPCHSEFGHCLRHWHRTTFRGTTAGGHSAPAGGCTRAQTWTACSANWILMAMAESHTMSLSQQCTACQTRCPGS